MKQQSVDGSRDMRNRTDREEGQENASDAQVVIESLSFLLPDSLLA